MSENGEFVEGSYWLYAPNKGAPVFFAVAFCISGLWQLWQGYRYKCWHVTWHYATVAAIFTAGFITREIGAFHYDSLPVYIASVCLVYAAPPLYEAANYHILGRVLFYVPYHSPIHPGRVWTTFAFLAAVVESLSGIGASYTANVSLPQSMQDTGKALLKTSLILQLVIVNCFVALAVTFHRRCLKAGIHNRNVNSSMLTLYVSTALIEARTIYRTVEYFQLAGVQIRRGMSPNELPPEWRYEWFFYVFEASLMLVNAYLWNFRHASKYLPTNTKVFLGTDGVTEIEGPGYKDKRGFLATLLDPFDWYGMVTGRDKKDRFWEAGQGQGEVVGAKGEAKSASHETA
ncbi:rta1 domain protein [Diaporthe amygdali]|uniref:rta1 domain protein n=1 Tax=Phomopsis amygdali TaxID=1214568 RepID=UPI0022FEE4EF|nr:rta1 domain protein [Diaporthe amygdali]KAJ0116734.1 rta1 domain protein [Diaporthe amygdali]